jgi:hypothetical protein
MNTPRDRNPLVGLAPPPPGHDPVGVSPVLISRPPEPPLPLHAPSRGERVGSRPCDGNRALRESKPLRYAPVRCISDQALHRCRASLGDRTRCTAWAYRVSLLLSFRTCCWRSYVPLARPSSFASHSLTLFSYQTGPIASWRLGRGMRRKFLLER